ncbi:MAG TPA: PKD domain-containing protein [Rudaea sp.]|nr:PKD domain-containing protein [Rudaea sp.]
MITSRHSISRQKASTLIACIVALTAGSLAAGSAFGNDSTDNPYSPAYGHAYRHGVVPTREAWEHMKEYANQNAGPGAATSSQTLSYGGGIDGIGVTSGTPRVYLVVYGSQWGTQGTDANGNWTFTGDSAGAMPYLQRLFKGIGTGGELWSGVMTQYCDGAVSAGATSCPSGASFVGYPSAGAFAGIMYDNSVASPSNATAAQLGQEAVKAAGFFGNTTAASNRYAQYVILSPSGTHPDGFNTPRGGFCAWHDWNGDPYVGVASSYGDIAFTNMPYVLDLGTSCGENFVNSGSAGTLDGFSIVEGHEYAETITDQNPAGGWTSASSGQENADECAWISSGQGASANVVMGNGTYAMQSTWSNDTNRCDISHPIVTSGGGGGGGGGPTASFSYVANRLVVNFTDTSTDSGATITTHAWTFGDGSTSTATNPGHTYSKPGSYSVKETVTDSNNASASVTKTISVKKH